MQKVPMIVSGKSALVDADMVNKVAKKQLLVQKLVELQPAGADLQEAIEVASKIIRLNRTIRHGCVQFI